MRATEVLDTNIEADCQSEVHKKRYRAVLAGVEAAIAGKCVAVTALIIVDWSPLTGDEKWHVLRASLPMGGRTVTLYEEVHPQENYGAPGVHRQFLENLGRLLPKSCQPIIVTDAGFKNPWFRAVEAQGWAWLGRVRGQVQLTREREEVWLGCKDLGRLMETNRPEYLGQFLLTRSSPMRCHAFGLGKPPKGRVHKTVRGKRALSCILRLVARNLARSLRFRLRIIT